jgi:hypothetical protein
MLKIRFFSLKNKQYDVGVYFIRTKESQAHQSSFPSLTMFGLFFLKGFIYLFIFNWFFLFL